MVIPASLVAQMVKNLDAMQETQVWSLGQEDSLEKEMATHSNILAWEIPWISHTAFSYSFPIPSTWARIPVSGFVFKNLPDLKHPLTINMVSFGKPNCLMVQNFF